jgi:hypothetical protein
MITVARLLVALTGALTGVFLTALTNSTWGYEYIRTRLNKPPPENGTTYDFIVVGSGS